MSKRKKYDLSSCGDFALQRPSHVAGKKASFRPASLVTITLLCAFLLTDSFVPSPSVSRAADVLIVVLTFEHPDLLKSLLESILSQRLTYTYHVVVVDTGCLKATTRIVQESLGSTPNSHLKLCDNPGYGVGNNEAVRFARSIPWKWVLFLNDDLVLEDEFLEPMLKLSLAQPKAAAVGCRIVSSDGKRLQESGSIVWNDGTCRGCGRSAETEAEELLFARPVDYVSGACLLVTRKDFASSGGFDTLNFPAYYEDTDIQMHFQHILQKQVWIEPFAVARHGEHSSFGKENSLKLMQKSESVFRKKWEAALLSHLPNPARSETNLLRMASGELRACDLRARDENKMNILYIDDKLPNKAMGSGYARVVDNLLSLSMLGHRVTAAAIPPHEQREYDASDLASHRVLRQNGIEVTVRHDLQLFMQQRRGFYDVVIVSRPSTLAIIKDWLIAEIEADRTTFVYDAEALWYRRDEKLLESLRSGIAFPGASTIGVNVEISGFGDLDGVAQRLKTTKEQELSLLSLAHVVTTVSDTERKIISKILGTPENVFTIGHVIDTIQSTPEFKSRDGILFIGAFNGQMYYNGDAVWHFLHHAYGRLASMIEKVPPLVVAGKGIPKYLKNDVAENDHFRNVQLVDSPSNLGPLYKSARVFIATHLYGAGLQYKVSEALATGIPVVTSKETALNFGFEGEGTSSNDFSRNPTCTGGDDEGVALCVKTLLEDEVTWNKFRSMGFRYLAKTHSREALNAKWIETLTRAKSVSKMRRDTSAH